MFSRIHKRITFANVAMTLVLVFAMGGGAYAAGKFIITSTKQIKPSVLAQLKGRNGRNGTNGTNGTNGVQGPLGAEGKEGKAGTNGKEGGTGPKGDTGPQGVKGDTGPQGVKGDTGPQGAQGEPWTPNNSLPSKASEKGTWIIQANAAAAGEVFDYAFSFPIPLGEKIAEANIGIENLTPMTECPGGLGKPEANPGHFCLFIRTKVNAKLSGGEDLEEGGGMFDVGKTGMILSYTSEAAGPVAVDGIWAVTEK